MIQVYAQKNGQLYELDLYKEEPIKLTISAEDITDIPKIESSFSRQFRIPATTNNSQFFNYWYELDVLDFDVTQRVKAEIHVDGLIFKTGELRLQAAYKNNETDNIDLEVVFFGETRDFASELGDLFMNQLDVSDLSHVLNHSYLHSTMAVAYDATITYYPGAYVYFSIFPGNPQYPYITYRCTAQNINVPPTNTSYWAPLTDDAGDPLEWNGGKLRYGLAVRGYEYDSDGNIITEDDDSTMKVNGQITLDNQKQFAFTNQTNAITPNQYTPFIQVKYLIDKIFARSSYTYSSDSIFNEEWFSYLYTDGISEPLPYTRPVDARVVANSSQVQEVDTSLQLKVEIDETFFDPENAWNGQLSRYEVQVSGDHDISYEVSVSSFFDEFAQNVNVNLQLVKNGVTTLETDDITLTPSQFTKTFNIGPITHNLEPGDYLELFVQFYGGERRQIEFAQFNMLSTPLAITGASLMKEDVTITDFLKSILNRFRLVMVPSKDEQGIFTVKPWKEYITSGEIFDWTYKLDNSKDIVIKPVFFEQSAIINFTDVEDLDKYNELHIDDYNYVYGRLLYDSNNVLLKDERDIENIFAPTPVAELMGASGEKMIIPFLAKESQELDKDNVNKFIPLLPKPRLLFWNGMQPTTEGFFDEKVSGNEHFVYSSFSPFDFYGQYFNTTNGVGDKWSNEPQTDTLDLNWKKDIRYFNVNNNLGESVYDRYWNTYVESLYSKDARIITAYFKLDAEDLRTLTFDDIIFIKNNYYRIQKVYDAPLNEVNVVKVDLVKLIDYTPEPCEVARPILISADITDATSPTADDGQLVISFIGGVPPVAGYALEVTGPGGYTYNDTINQLQEITLTNLAEGDYTVSITDDCPTTTSKVFTIADGCANAAELTSSYVETLPTEVWESNGSIEVTSIGGFGPYSVRLQSRGGYDATLVGNPVTFTNLAPDVYYYTITDVCGVSITSDDIDLNPVTNEYLYSVTSPTGTNLLATFDSVNLLEVGTYVELGTFQAVVRRRVYCDTGTTPYEITAINTTPWGAYVTMLLGDCETGSNLGFFWSTDLTLLTSYREGDMVEINGNVGMLEFIYCRHNQGVGTEVSTIAPGSACPISVTRYYDVVPCGYQDGTPYPPCSANQYAVYTSSTPLKEGQSVKLDGLTDCYVVTGYYSHSAPPTTPLNVTNVYNDCDSCS